MSASGAGKITVLIADDHPVVRQGLRVLLSLHADIDVVGEASDGAEAVELAAAVAPDVVLLDLKLPGLDGLAVLAELRDRNLPAKVLVLTSVADSASVTVAMRAGATGFLYKDVDPDALVRAIRSVHDGHTVLAPEAAGTLVRARSRPAAAGRPRRADRAGARGARADRRGPVQQGDRAPAAHVGEDGENPRQLGAGQARRGRSHPGRAARGAQLAGLSKPSPQSALAACLMT